MSDDETLKELGEKAEAAFRRAAGKVVERARQFGTPIVTWRDGRVVEVSPEVFADEPWMKEDAPGPG